MLLFCKESSFICPATFANSVFVIQLLEIEMEGSIAQWLAHFLLNQAVLGLIITKEILMLPRLIDSADGQRKVDKRGWMMGIKTSFTSWTLVLKNLPDIFGGAVIRALAHNSVVLSSNPSSLVNFLREKNLDKKGGGQHSTVVSILASRPC